MSWWWSWLLTLVGVTGFILAGRKVWWAWYVNIGCQGLWISYAIVTRQSGFIFASIFYTVVFTQNAVRWTRERNKDGAQVAEVGSTSVGSVDRQHIAEGQDTSD